MEQIVVNELSLPNSDELQVCFHPTLGFWSVIQGWGNDLDSASRVRAEEIPVIGDPLLTKIGGHWISLDEAVLARHVEPPQSGPEMMRVALQHLIAASENGTVKGLYGPLLNYIVRALDQPSN